MTLPEDVILESEHRIAKLTAREARILARIRRALRSLVDVRRKLATDRREHTAATRALLARRSAPE